MELKYYLRGLGIGIAMTAIIMGIALSGKGTMTDEDIIARAKELGMVENTVLLNGTDEDAAQVDADDVSVTGQDIAELPQEDDVTAGSTETDQDDAAAIGSTEQDQDDTAAADDMEADSDDANSNGDTEADQDDATVGSTEADNETDSESGNANEAITSAALKTITIKGGDGSYTVAKKLEDVGVVTSASNFDTFLCEHGYDKRLRTGTFSIPADASDEQIARIITGAE